MSCHLSLFYVTVATVFYKSFVSFVFIMKCIFVYIVALRRQECEQNTVYPVRCICVLRPVLRIYCFCCCRRRRGFTLNI